MRKFSPLFVFLFAITLMTSCTKEGPEGPVGATGPQGAPGNNGTPGAPGRDGAGITTYSAWFTAGNNWTTTAVYPVDFILRKTAPSVTQSIIDQGIVLAYMKNDPLLEGLSSFSTVFPLPYTGPYGWGWTDSYDFMLEKPNEIVFVYKSDNPWAASDLAIIQFRYVTIPGTVAGGRNQADVVTYGGFTKEELLKMPYDQLAAHFNIPADGASE